MTSDADFRLRAELPAALPWIPTGASAIIAAVVLRSALMAFRTSQSEGVA